MDLHNGHKGVQFKCYSFDKTYSRMDLVDFTVICATNLSKMKIKRKKFYIRKEHLQKNKQGNSKSLKNMYNKEDRYSKMIQNNENKMYFKA